MSIEFSAEQWQQTIQATFVDSLQGSAKSDNRADLLSVLSTIGAFCAHAAELHGLSFDESFGLLNLLEDPNEPSPIKEMLRKAHANWLAKNLDISTPDRPVTD